MISENLRASILAMTIGLTQCANGQTAAVTAVNGVPIAPNVRCQSNDCASYSTVPYIRKRTKYGIACLGTVAPGQNVPAELPPFTYRVADIGKPGVPKLSIAEKATVAAIGRLGNGVSSLRFAVDIAGVSSNAVGFVVFNASDGACPVDAPGYEVLSEPCLYFEPGDDPYTAHEASSCPPILKRR